MANFELFYGTGDTVLFLGEILCKVIAVFPHRIYIKEIGTSKEYLCENATDVCVIGRKKGKIL